MKAVSPQKGIAGAWDLRRPERQLLLVCLLCVSLGFLMVLGSGRAVGRAPGLPDLLPLLFYALCLFAVHLTLVFSRFRGDQVLPAVVAFLAGVGLLAQDRMGVFDIDTESGDLVWVTRYPRVGVERSNPNQPAWHAFRDLNPCVLNRGIVFAAPADSEQILALDAASGQHSGQGISPPRRHRVRLDNQPDSHGLLECVSSTCPPSLQTASC